MITVTLVNNTGIDGVFTVRVVPDEGLTAETAAEVAVPQGERCSFPLTVTMDEGRTLICEKNRITLTAEGAGAAAQCGIGVIGKTRTACTARSGKISWRCRRLRWGRAITAKFPAPPTRNMPTMSGVII